MAKSDDNLVKLDGEWDLARKEELLALLDRLKPRNGGATIDLRGVTYADATVLHALSALATRFQGHRIMLVGPQPNVLRLLKIVSLDILFDIVEASPQAAVEEKSQSTASPRLASP